MWPPSNARREAIRAERRDWPVKLTLAHEPSPQGMTRVGPIGDSLEVMRDAEGNHWTRCMCGTVLGPAAENWREYAGCDVADAEEIGPMVRVNAAMEIRRYACPGCGRLHAVDLCRKGDPDPHDVRLAL